MKLSVVIPNLNYGRYLQVCLDSLMAQSFKDYEVILVDSGSTDETFEVLKNYPSVKVLMDTPPSGPVNAVNKAIAIMKGQYFIQLNSDCWLDPSIYEKLVTVLDSNPSLGMVYSSWLYVSESGQFQRYAKQPGKFRKYLLLKENFVDSSSAMIPKTVLDAVHNFDPEFPNTMDWIMAAKIGLRYPIAFVNEHLLYFRVHQGQISTGYKAVLAAKKARKEIERMYGIKGKIMKALI